MKCMLFSLKLYFFEQLYLRCQNLLSMVGHIHRPTTAKNSYSSSKNFPNVFVILLSTKDIGLLAFCYVTNTYLIRGLQNESSYLEYI